MSESWPGFADAAGGAPSGGSKLLSELGVGMESGWAPFG